MDASDSELDNFLATTLARQIAADEALHNGDPAPRLALWSRNDPVTVFGAVKTVAGWEEVSQAFHWLGTRFSNCAAFTFDLVAAGVSGDLAYTVGYEHTSVSIEGVPAEPYTLRVTHVYRRENGEWKIVHRHADSVGGPPPLEQSLPAEAPTT
ncbi:MAG TPA: nuclear transport factor 2 family protein [Ktedonobacterales bacterium]|nr:nuclear transport factor 2 family protein [Ktedonobacterales bacterium]